MASLLKNANPENEVEHNSLCSIEAEQAILGAMLIDNSCIIHIGSLEEKHFYEPVHRRLFKAMLVEWQHGRNFNPITLRPIFDTDPDLIDIGRAAYLGKLAAAAIAVYNLQDYVTLVVNLALRRTIADACDKARAAIYDVAGGDPLEIALSISAIVNDATGDSQGSFFQDDYEVTEMILEEMKRDAKPQSTGYYKLDLAMDGGLYPGKSYGFAARKKMGKTILAGSISCNLNLAGVKHLFICGEMSPAEVQKRTLARLMRVKQSLFNSKEGRNSIFMKRILDEISGSKRAVIYKNAPGITFEDLKRYVLLARMRKKIDGFILDYWQLVGGKPKGKSTAEHLDEVAQWIADTCRKYNLWSITMAQINQEGNTRGGEGIRLAFDQVYTLQAPGDDPGRTTRWLDMSDTRYTAWRSVGTENNPGFYLNEFGPYFTEDGQEALNL